MNFCPIEIYDAEIEVTIVSENANIQVNDIFTYFLLKSNSLIRQIKCRLLCNYALEIFHLLVCSIFEIISSKQNSHIHISSDR